jgi:hypothetical protein
MGLGEVAIPDRSAGDWQTLSGVVRFTRVQASRRQNLHHFVTPGGRAEEVEVPCPAGSVMFRAGFAGKPAPGFFRRSAAADGMGLTPWTEVHGYCLPPLRG